MAQILRYNLDNEDALANLGRALGSPIRIRILRLIASQKLSIAEIARELEIPPSSAALHIKELEQVGLIRIEQQPGTRGLMKLCTRYVDKINIRLYDIGENANNIITVEMPIGFYSSCNVSPSCGLATPDTIIGGDDATEAFYFPERFQAGLLWTSSGFVEYNFPNKLYSLPYRTAPTSVLVSMELCSETIGYKNDWKSDITLWINGKDCGTWTSPGDFGDRRGKYNSLFWGLGRTQYGLLTTWEINGEGSFVNGLKMGSTTIEGLSIMQEPGIAVRIGNKEDAEYKGGFNLFGKGFGDYSQDILMSIIYEDIVR